MNKKTKTVLIISFSLLFVGVCVGVIFLVTRPPKTYPKEPVKQESLFYTTQQITLENSSIEKKDYPLYTLSNALMTKEAESFALSIQPKIKNVVKDQSSYYEWSIGKDVLIYRLNQNKLSFSFEKGIAWDEVEISSSSFSLFVKKYFNKDWKYKVSQKEEMIDGSTVYFANRILGDVLIETNEYKNETDYFIYKDGRILGGSLLLTEFIDTTKTLPTITAKELGKYININEYPKEIYPNYSTLGGTVLKEVNYLGDEFEAITETLSNCTGTDLEVVYLYKNFSQETLTPVYKIPLQCKITYKETKYTVPAIGFVNAVSPDYIANPE